MPKGRFLDTGCTLVKKSIFFILVISLWGCAGKINQDAPSVPGIKELKPEVVSAIVPENQKYRDILVEEFKDIMVKKENFLLIDARTPEEFATGYIEKATNIPYTEIKNKARTFG